MVFATTKARYGFPGSLALALFFACYSVAGTAGGDGNAKHCGPSAAVTPLATEVASAGILTNLSNRPGSIRATSNRMLGSAIETARTEASAKRIIFKSIPELSTKADTDDQMCERYEKVTTKTPLEFNDKRFASVDALTDWIMDFTQGKGVEGKSLYEQCPGKCSPQYTWWIDPDKTGFMVKARVVCGPPRDRDGDKYHLSIALATWCPVAESQ